MLILVAFARVVKEDIVVELVIIKQRLKKIKHTRRTRGCGVAKIRRGYVNFEARPRGLRPKDIQIRILILRN